MSPPATWNMANPNTQAEANTMNRTSQVFIANPFRTACKV
jgi:hypothetical protein